MLSARTTSAMVALALGAGLLSSGCAKDRNPADGESTVENTDETCRDGIDNDGDGLFDCADFDCQPNGEPIAACQGDGTNEAGDDLCGDGIDNDNDGFTDCNDNECSEGGASFCVENSAELCADSADNDGNGFLDCQDFGCDAFCN
jgi:hypothetical protein